MFEKKHERPLSARLFAWRAASFSRLALLLIAVSLCVGVLGYHCSAGFSLVDSILNACMILTGMGPVGELPSTETQLSASVYSLLSGLVVFIFMGILLTARVHRLLHRFHFDAAGAGEE